MGCWNGVSIHFNGVRWFERSVVTEWMELGAVCQGATGVPWHAASKLWWQSTTVTCIKLQNLLQHAKKTGTYSSKNRSTLFGINRRHLKWWQVCVPSYLTWVWIIGGFWTPPNAQLEKSAHNSATTYSKLFICTSRLESIFLIEFYGLQVMLTVQKVLKLFNLFYFKKNIKWKTWLFYECLSSWCKALRKLCVKCAKSIKWTHLLKIVT